MRLTFLALCFACLTASAAAADRLVVFAAASLGAVLEEVALQWQGETGHEVVISAAGSATLARQIDAGAPADVVIFANQDWMDWLERRGRVDPLTRRTLLFNRLILVGHADAPRATLDTLPDALGVDRLALALVDAVPAGIYARQALESLGLWDQVATQVVQTDNVTAAYTLVRSGAVGYGIVYVTDMRPSSPVRRLAGIPADSHPPITYPGAVVDGAAPLAKDFLDFLSRAPAQRQFRRYGFEIAP